MRGLPRGGRGGRGATSTAAEPMRWTPLPGRCELRPHGPLSCPHRGCGQGCRLPQEAPRPWGRARLLPPRQNDLGPGEGRVLLLEAGWSCRPRPPPPSPEPGPWVELGPPRAASAGKTPAGMRRQRGPGLGGSLAPTSADPTSGRSRPLPQHSADRVTCVGRPGSLPRPWSGGRGLSAETGRGAQNLCPRPLRAHGGSLPHPGGLAAWPPSSPPETPLGPPLC